MAVRACQCCPSAKEPFKARLALKTVVQAGYRSYEAQTSAQEAAEQNLQVSVYGKYWQILANMFMIPQGSG
jgi:hypothetical protein